EQQHGVDHERAEPHADPRRFAEIEVHQCQRPEQKTRGVLGALLLPKRRTREVERELAPTPVVTGTAIGKPSAIIHPPPLLYRFLAGRLIGADAGEPAGTPWHRLLLEPRAS